MKYKAILFDLDGTLLDTLDDLTDATNAVLRHFGFPEHARDAYKYFVGGGAADLMRAALPANLDPGPADRQALMTQFLIEYTNYLNKKTKPYPGIVEMLHTLHTRGIQLSILSNKPDFFTKQCVNDLLSDCTFRVVYGARDGVPKKPDPQACLEIAAMMGLLPADFLYVGDSGIDMCTARAAGMQAMGVLWGFRTAAELQENGAHVLVETPAQILDYCEDTI